MTLTRTRRAFTLLALTAALAVLAACGDDATPGASSPTVSETPAPTTALFTEDEFQLTLPIGWTREDVTGPDIDAKKAIRFSGADGNYFIVALDPNGSDFAPDAIWRYEVDGTGFKVIAKEDCQGPPPCSTTDARYDVYLMWKPVNDQKPPVVVAGHTWYFILGNSKTPAIDEKLFEGIVESIEVTA